MDTAINVEALTQQISANVEAWERVDDTLREIVKRAGGKIVARIELPAPIQDKFHANHKWLPRQYSVAVVTVRIFSDEPKRVHFSAQYGVTGRNGVFFPDPETPEARSMINRLDVGGLPMFIAVFFGTAQKFVESLLKAHLAAAEII